MIAKTVKKCARAFWLMLIGIVVSLAIVIQLARVLFPFLDDQKILISKKLSESMGATISIGAIEGEWIGLRPKLTLKDVVVASSRQGSKIIQIGTVGSEINILTALFDWRQSINNLVFLQLKTNFLQKADGQWHINGLKTSPAGNSEIVIDDPLDIFLFGRRIELVESTFTLQYRSGRVAEVEVPNIYLENDADFHRLSASFGVDEDVNALNFVMEGYGDPRDGESFDAKAYLELNAFPLDKTIAALGLKELPWLKQGNFYENQGVTSKLWLNGTFHKGFSLQGSIRLPQLPLYLGHAQSRNQWQVPESIRANMFGRWTPQLGWNLNLQNTVAHWPDYHSRALNVSLVGTLISAPKLLIEELDLGAWHEIAVKSGALTNPAKSILGKLQPKGLLKSLSLEFTGKKDGWFNARAYLSGVSVESFRGAPQVKQLEGFAEFSAFDGRVVLASDNGFSIHYPTIYYKPHNYKSAAGEVRWEIRPMEKMAYVSSGKLVLADEYSVGRGRLYLSLPFKHNESIEPEMVLLVGVDHGSLSLYKKYVPFKIPKALYQWIDTGIGDGELSSGAFAYRGSLLKKPLRKAAIQLSAEIDHSEIEFDKDWPELTDVKAGILLDDSAFYTRVDNASLNNVTLRKGQLTLTKGKKSNKQALKLLLEANGQAKDVRNLLLESPLHKKLQGPLSQLRVGGSIAADLNLVVPLTAEKADNEQVIRLYLKDNTLKIKPLRLTFEDVEGSLHYSNESGLFAETIQSKLWGKQLSASLKTDVEVESAPVEIEFTSDIELKDLNAWLDRPELHFMSGSTHIQGSVHLPTKGINNEVTTRISSDLMGVNIALPNELYKDDSTPLNTEFFIRSKTSPTQKQSYTFNFGTIAELHVEQDNNELVGIALGLHQPSKAITPGVFRVDGRMKQVGVDHWLAVSEKYQSLLVTQKIKKDPMPLHLNLQVDDMQFKQWSLGSTDLTIQDVVDKWIFSFNNDIFTGRYILPVDDVFHQLDLKHIRLPKGFMTRASDSLSDEEKNKNWNFSDLPNIKADIKEFTFEGSDMGKWAFSLYPKEDGALLDDLEGHIRGLSVLPKNDIQSASLHWYIDADKKLSTRIIAGLNANDVGEVLEAWQQEKVLTSESAYFDVDLIWPGSPADMSVKQLSGDIDATLKNGLLIQVADASNNPLMKLIGLLNVNNLARRLKLDFSDLSSRGTAYDSITGKALLDNGRVTFSEPVSVKAPSFESKVQGYIDAQTETYDARLDVTLPVTGGVTSVAAVAGGLPTAVGVFVLSKLFKKQFDRASSVRWKVSGSWNEPTYKVDKIIKQSGASESELVDGDGGASKQVKKSRKK